MTKTMEQYMSKTRGDYGSGVTRLKIDANAQFELKGKFLKELRDNTFSGCPMGLFRGGSELSARAVGGGLAPSSYFYLCAFMVVLPLCATIKRRGGDSSWPSHDPTFPINTLILVVDVQRKWRKLTTFSKNQMKAFSKLGTETSDGLVAIQAQLNNLGREIKMVNEKVYAAQVGCELCKGTHYTKVCTLKEEGETLEEAYYTQFGAPYQPGGQYRVAGPGFYQ
ncbi:hypothetical protein Tco_0681704 [Tanacetum coccineum]|uniref:Eukaryotic translation initiation factor 3 subunit G N-terminal domain-containing protein n=1 Tax=Tanacetum coccineum TaxID=301880 RepID=A0ABQ4XP81_9ASTR